MQLVSFTFSTFSGAKLGNLPESLSILIFKIAGES